MPGVGSQAWLLMLISRQNTTANDKSWRGRQCLRGAASNMCLDSVLSLCLQLLMFISGSLGQGGCWVRWFCSVVCGVKLGSYPVGHTGWVILPGAVATSPHTFTHLTEGMCGKEGIRNFACALLECVLGYLRGVCVCEVNHHCLSNRIVTKFKMTYNVESLKYPACYLVE